MNTLDLLFAVLEEPFFLLKLFFKIFAVLFVAHLIIKYVFKKGRKHEEEARDPRKDSAHADFVHMAVREFASLAQGVFQQHLDVLEKLVILHRVGQKFADMQINSRAILENYPNCAFLINALHHKMRRNLNGINRGHLGDEITNSTIFVPTGRGTEMYSVADILYLKGKNDPRSEAVKNETRKTAENFIAEVEITLKRIVSSNH